MVQPDSSQGGGRGGGGGGCSQTRPALPGDRSPASRRGRASKKGIHLFGCFLPLQFTGVCLTSSGVTRARLQQPLTKPARPMRCTHLNIFIFSLCVHYRWI